MSPPGRMHTLVLMGELDRCSAHTLEAEIERLEGATSAITLDLSKLTHIKSGTLYPLLSRLHDEGWLETRWEESPDPGRPPRLGKLPPHWPSIGGARRAPSSAAARVNQAVASPAATVWISALISCAWFWTTWLI